MPHEMRGALRKMVKELIQPMPLRLHQLSCVAFRKHYAIRRGVKFSEELLDQSRLYSTSFFRMHEIAHDRIQPRVRVDAKQHARSFAPLQLIDRRLRQQLAKDTDALHHRLAQ